ncbi:MULTISPECIES: ligase-associated DNA damage response exonuclease [unclassified Legionella]|uniref:ligase-associated DNA damage response exonuclease n=1 Tax=unclassified Legionella TaxID=2622702 RepID=UPI001E5C2D3F|nr:ligase-associated DNA damage response exonuclease [Legionella sp. 31fI33]MCC5013883.1 ligase-associated DNA damage response exonuclease [Legionella sp. 31fI33]
MHPKQWLAIKKEGLYCIPGDFFIDPVLPVKQAIITHAHSDHARSGHEHVFAHTHTIDLMAIRYDEGFASKFRRLAYHERVRVKDVEWYLLPAGHILGSSQVVIEYKGSRLIISGDYKRSLDPTCDPFVVEPCDVFITEATFGLPIFKHPPIEKEINKLLVSIKAFPHRCHLVGVYGLGKCQRLIRTLRLMGYLDLIFIHGALKKLCDFYESMKIDLGELRIASTLDADNSQGKIVLCPPSALRDRWSRRFANVVVSMASGWMQTRARAKQQGVELPLVISDHADWFELIQTIKEINPQEVWITHGQEEALVHYLNQQGYKAQALHLLGYEEHED